MSTDDYERWRDHYRRNPERDVDFETLSGEPVEPLYTPADVEGLDYDRDLGYPGHFPFTRGVYHSMYRGRLWTMRQFAGFGSVEETNSRYKFLLKQGQGGLSVAFDMPTLMGRDSDDPRSEGEVGRCGAATDSLDDFETLLDGIPLGDITTSMTIIVCDVRGSPATKAIKLLVDCRAFAKDLCSTHLTEILKGNTPTEAGQEAGLARGLEGCERHPWKDVEVFREASHPPQAI